MSCLCLPGYVGDADVECKLGNAYEFSLLKKTQSNNEQFSIIAGDFLSDFILAIYLIHIYPT